jgi:5-(carboxyamino)imidazole ribonucleotide synthase
MKALSPTSNTELSVANLSNANLPNPDLSTINLPAGLPLLPGSWLGMLGGGQLGRMFCMEAHALGYKVCVVDPDKNSPAGNIADRHICADYLDDAALTELARLCPAITTEFENVPAAALERLAKKRFVSPSAACVAIAQDRIAEKKFFNDAGIATAPYAAIESANIIPSLDLIMYPGILKTARMGYDGKGQVRVASRLELAMAWANLKQVPCVVEKRLDLAKELSVVVVRGADAQTVAYPPSENIHVEGILARSIHPARVDATLATKAVDSAKALANAMQYVGVLCIEFFVLGDGSLVVNEMAPRPHNSGHYSIDACYCSQFEQQVRAMAGLPLGSTELHSPAVMLNILGDAWANGEPNWAFVLRHPTAKLHLYGKQAARPGRKMGHITVVGADAQQVADAIALHLKLA